MIELAGEFNIGFIFGIFSALVPCTIGLIVCSMTYIQSSRELRYKSYQLESLLCNAEENQ